MFDGSANGAYDINNYWQGVITVQLNRGKLSALAEELGLDLVGITTAEPLVHLEARLRERIDENRITPFEEADLGKRLFPAALLEGCRSIVTLAVSYATSPDPVLLSPDQPTGLVARFARPLDYHRVITAKADLLVKAIRKEQGSSFRSRILCDTSPLPERELALRSGLGTIGKNCTLITSLYGSYVSLATILFDFELEPDLPLEYDPCGSCDHCLKACPTGALIKPYTIDPFRCLSYLTQASGNFPAQYRALLGTRLFGCDRCQEVCPHNLGAATTSLQEYAFHFFPARPLLLSLLKMTRREFDLTIGQTAAGWRGKTTIQRNAIIALGNSESEQALLPLTRLLENDSRPLIRQHCAWSIGRLGGAKARFALEKARQRDPVESVKNEAEEALKNLTFS